MKVIIIGAGVIGVTSAYYLARQGYDVTVIERNSEAATETSWGNAGFLSPSDAFAWASPHALKTAFKSLYNKELGIEYNLRLDPRLWGWTAKFLRQCMPAATKKNSAKKLALALYAKQCMKTLLAETDIRFHQSKNGIFYFTRNRAELQRMEKNFRFLEEQDDTGELTIEVMRGSEMVNIDPAFEALQHKIYGGIFARKDHTGSCSEFTQSLAKYCQDHLGIRFLYETKVKSLNKSQQQIDSLTVQSAKDENKRSENLTADIYLMCGGIDSVFLCDKIGIKLPMYPVKGYSITVPVLDSTRIPKMGMVDEEKLVAMSRVGENLRIASTAEFSGFSREYQQHNFRKIYRAAEDLYPGALALDKAVHWAGLRPMTPSSVPLIGKSDCQNLYLNTGHGHLGWTTACGSAKAVADLISGHVPEIPLADFALS